MTKETVYLKKTGSEYLMYTGAEDEIQSDFMIVGVLNTLDNGDKRIYILTNFATANWEEQEVKQNITEMMLTSTLNTWEVITNPANKLFQSGQMIFNNSYYVDKNTGQPVENPYDENGNLLPTVETNYSFYYKAVIKPAILMPLADAIKNYIV